MYVQGMVGLYGAAFELLQLGGTCKSTHVQFKCFYPYARASLPVGIVNYHDTLVIAKCIR